MASWSLALIGLANILGSLIAGSCTQRFRSKYILAVMYGSRALLIGWYLVAPISHQIGGFLGAYLGGLALVRFGDYQWMWYADMALAAAAAVIHLPIREARIAQVASPA